MMQCATADGGRIAGKASLPFHHEHAMASIYFVVRPVLVAGMRRVLQPVPLRCHARQFLRVLASLACAGILSGCGGGGGSTASGSSAGLLATDTSLSPTQFAASSLNLLAGQIGGPGSIDGAGKNARFNGVSAIAFDVAGNEYVADTANNTIRKITPAGVVSTVAGRAGTAGSVDGVGAAELVLDKVSLSADALLGEKAVDATEHLETILDTGLAAVCAEAVGALDRLLAATVEYTRTRKQFGTPIARFQALQHRMAEMVLYIEQARSMSYLAAVRISESDPVLRRASLSAAKVIVGQACRFVGQQAVQLHGGMGVTDELDVSHYFKRLMAIELQFGSTDQHLESYAAALA